MDAVSQTKRLPQTVEVVLGPRAREVAVTAFLIDENSDDSVIGLLLRDVTQERESLRRRDEFIAVASHELRTPITSIMGFSELLIQREPPRDVRKEWLRRIHAESIRLTSIIDSLLNVSRIQAGSDAVVLEKVAVAPAIHDAIRAATPTGTGHVFTVTLPEELPEVVADQDKLRQVLVNLLDNAVKFSPSGSEIRISGKLEPELQRVVVSIADEGMGISREDFDDLFTTFHRVHRSETATIRGTGLGLYAVKALLVMMRGEVWLESAMNQGSTFYFSLPLDFPTPVATPDSEESQVSPLQEAPVIRR